MDLSIIIPTYNSAAYIKQTLDHLLNSSILKPYLLEIIVLDDGSTDNTKEEVLKIVSSQKKSIKYINNQENLGQKASIHIGLNESEGSYALTFDDDLQYSDAEIDAIYQKMVHSSNWIVGSKSAYKPSLKYHFVKKLVFALLNVFFKKYIEAGYFSSFKMYDLQELRKNNIQNVFVFWEIPPTKLGVIEVIKKKSIRNYSNYNFINFIKLTSTVILRIAFLCLLYCLLPIALLIFLVSKVYFFLIAGLCAFVFVMAAISLEKRKYSRLINH